MCHGILGVPKDDFVLVMVAMVDKVVDGCNNNGRDRERENTKGVE